MKTLTNSIKNIHHLTNVKRSNAAYKSAPTKILESIQNRKPLKLGSSCGINAAGTELTIFVFKEDYDGIKAGTIFLDARVPEVITNEELEINMDEWTISELSKYNN